MNKGKRNLFMIFLSFICITMLFTTLPLSTVAADTGTVTIYYQNQSITSPSLSEAIKTANNSENDPNPVLRIELSAGIFSPTDNNQFHITKSNLIIEGVGSGTVIDTGDYNISGQAGMMISGDDVTIRDLEVKSGDSNNISAVKVTSNSSGDSVQNCTISNVTIESLGSGIDIHGATAVDVIGVIIDKAGKVGISVANSTGVYINNCTTGMTLWPADIGLMYKANDPDYSDPCQVTLGPDNTFTHNIITSERPANAPGGPDTLNAPEWVMKRGLGDVKWEMVPIENTDIPFADLTNNMNFSNFDLACEYSTVGSTITMQNDISDELIIPASARNRDLIIDGGGHTLSGGLSTQNGADLSSLTLQNFVFEDNGISLTAGIDEINIVENRFININGYSLEIAVPDGTDSKITVGENSFISNSSSSFVQISGNDLSGNINLAYNYWNGLNPYTATAAGGSSIAELQNAGTATKTVFPYYADAARTILVNEDDAWISPKTASFDKNSSGKNYRDIVVTLTLGMNTLDDITCEGTMLSEGDQYTVDAGVYTFSKEWMKELSIGTHTIAFELSDGTSLNFNLSVSDSTPGSAGDDPGDDPEDGPGFEQTVVPETGDYGSMATWMTLLLIALCGIILAFYFRKKMPDNQDL